MTLTIKILSLLVAGTLFGQADAKNLLERARVVDLTHEFSSETIYWPTAKPFSLEVVFNGETAKGYHYEANNFAAAEHGGTHLDAPNHFAKGRKAASELSLDQLMGAGVVVDVKDKVRADPAYQITAEDFARFEAKNGRIADGAIVLLNTGFARYWPDRKKYLGTEERGEKAVAKLKFPGLHPQGAEWLMKERQVKAVGIDTASIDHGPSTLFETHRTLFEKNVPAFENVAGLDSLPARGFTVIALPMKIKGGSGGPLRIIALIPS